MCNYRVIDVVSRYRVSTILVHIADTRSSTALSLALSAYYYCTIMSYLYAYVHNGVALWLAVQLLKFISLCVHMYIRTYVCTRIIM